MRHEIIQFNPVDEPSTPAIALLRDDETNEYILMKVTIDSQETVICKYLFLSAALQDMGAEMIKASPMAQWIVNS